MSYDLDIESYSIADLKKLFKIKNNDSKKLVEESIVKSITKCEKNTSDESKILLKFLSQAKVIIYSHYDIDIVSNNRITEKSTKLIEQNHAVQEQIQVPVDIVSLNKYPSSNLNPLSKREITRIVNVDTLFRLNYVNTSASDFTWNLPETINNVVSMKVIATELPNMWYTVSSKNKSNTFKIHLYNVKDYPDKVYNIIVPDGNYVAPQMAETLNNIFTNIGNGLQYVFATIDERTSKTSFRFRSIQDDADIPGPLDNIGANYSPNFYYKLDFNISGNENNMNDRLKKTLGWFLGFRNNLYEGIATSLIVDRTMTVLRTHRGVVTSESSYGSTLNHYVFLDINDYNKNEMTNTFLSTTPDAYIGNNIMARITVTKIFNNIFFDNSSDKIFKQRDFLGPVRISKLKIRLLNRFGDVVDLNSNDFSLALEFKILY
uniref:Uncharacterized protein n=1 Tax=viral metagenome TaxID=1070528 RepID=A0A6C0JAA6_9ZZZZ